MQRALLGLEETWLSPLVLLPMSFVTVNKLPGISNLDFPLYAMQIITTCPLPLAQTALKINLYDNVHERVSGPGKSDANIKQFCF